MSRASRSEPASPTWPSRSCRCDDVDDLPTAISEAARVLVPGGHLAVAIVHPINSAGRFEQATQGLSERDRRFVINDSYLAQRRYADDIERDGLLMRFESMHRRSSRTRALSKTRALPLRRCARSVTPIPTINGHACRSSLTFEPRARNGEHSRDVADPRAPPCRSEALCQRPAGRRPALRATGKV
jgi:SAM-dependent methyltransferase